ncbi:hypothetical protein GIB67_042179 [Kingdonia uniflora]|uniref:DUF4005 domain-containing protein n=1 Tax=Kingdonia uniflora TaxID=39325 RepID=A0A7J7NXI8_9MAGN|nr:hypothetical protein GIB67_042179 [Kingdonia uniflora]
MSSIASFLVFMSGEDGSSMGASLEPLTTQRKEYRPHGLQAPRGGLIPMQFDDIRQPIGPNRKFLCTFIGETTRENLSPLKSSLRKNNYDAYETDEERESKRPKGVKKEDWIEFMDRLSTLKEQVKREKGKAARSKMHSPHTTGRLGTSGKKEILEKGRPKGSVMRYEIFMACHTKEDDTYPEEMKERMEYGEYGNGHVRGYNGHVNKASLRVSEPFRRVIERERVNQDMHIEVQGSLEVEANERRQLEKRVAAFESRESPCGAYMHRPFENNVSTSKQFRVIFLFLSRSFRDKDINTPIVSAQTESSTYHYIDPSNKHVIAVAATTVAVAEVVVIVAHAAAVVVKLTGYLAKKALWALKGWVKLQALVRGHIVRKKIGDTMRAMQVLVRVQAWARARASSGPIMEIRCQSNKPSMSHPGPPTPKKYERTRCSNSTSHNQFSSLKRSAVKQNSCYNFDFGKAYLGWHHLEGQMEKYRETPIRSTPMDDEKREKILEIDIGKPLFNSTGHRGLHSSYNTLSLDQNSQSLTSMNSPSRDSAIAQRSTSSVSSGEV